MRERKISESTIHRLSHYYRALNTLEKEHFETISSKELAKREKLTPAQVRKDLSFFGSFGTRGLGYPVKELKGRIAKILGIDRTWNVALIGVGNIGSALGLLQRVPAPRFQHQGALRLRPAQNRLQSQRHHCSRYRTSRRRAAEAQDRTCCSGSSGFSRPEPCRSRRALRHQSHPQLCTYQTQSP